MGPQASKNPLLTLSGSWDACVSWNLLGCGASHRVSTGLRRGRSAVGTCPHRQPPPAPGQESHMDPTSPLSSSLCLLLPGPLPDRQNLGTPRRDRQTVQGREGGGAPGWENDRPTGSHWVLGAAGAWGCAEGTGAGQVGRSLLCPPGSLLAWGSPAHPDTQRELGIPVGDLAFLRNI